MKTFLKHIKVWYIKKRLWRSADILVMLGQSNGRAQYHINKAKDAIYDAIQELK